ncbi:M24 family metallopeptidase [Arthrobacter sp. UC242_113]|uniref:M24 family metallopeptidase n=1 Tax=Arthrobacter sp. UC242_113 TaxID=3374550 RepID=UPI0037563226
MQTEATEREVAAAITQSLRVSGSVFDIVHVVANDFRGQAPRARDILEGDIVTVFVETSGPDGHWVELGAIYAIGRVSDRRRLLARRVIGALAGAAEHVRVDQEYGVLAENLGDAGRPTVGFGHGTGVDEIPVTVAPGARTRLRDGEAIVLHPSLTDPARGDAAGVANTFLTGPHGGTALSAHPLTLHHVSRTRTHLQ